LLTSILLLHKENVNHGVSYRRPRFWKKEKSLETCFYIGFQRSFKLGYKDSNLENDGVRVRFPAPRKHCKTNIFRIRQSVWNTIVGTLCYKNILPRFWNFFNPKKKSRFRLLQIS